MVSGDEEAALSYDGATRALPGAQAPVAVLDIGGGSTELIVGDAHGHVTAARSLDIGSVRLTERLMPSDPPTASEVEAAGRVVDEALDTLPSYGVQVGDAAHAGRHRGDGHDRRGDAARASTATTAGACTGRRSRWPRCTTSRRGCWR